MNKIAQIIIILFLSISCNKTKTAAKRLDGKWKVISYSKTDNEGLTEKTTDVSGELNLISHSSSDTTNTYTMQIAYNFPYDMGNIESNGSYSILNKGNYIVFEQAPLSVGTATFSTYRILTLTNSDLQIEGGDSLGNINTFLFRKL